MTPVTILVIADPADGFLKPLKRVCSRANVIVTRDRGRLLEEAPHADILFNADFSDRTLLFDAFRHAARLRWVHQLAAGVDKILSPEIVGSLVPLTNGRGVFRRALGEWAVGAMLFFAYDLRRVLRSQEAGKWDRFEHEELHGKTLGIIGYGEIGRSVAEHAKPFGMKILVVRRNPAADALADAVYVPAQIDEVIPQCDFVAVTAPLTTETRGLMGASQIARMKSSAVIVNVGRGPVIDETALIAALESKSIRGAALDVYDVEPLPAGHPFYRLENVLMSAHGADNLPDSRERGVEFFVENFERFVRNEPLHNLVDKHAGY